MGKAKEKARPVAVALPGVDYLMDKADVCKALKMCVRKLDGMLAEGRFPRPIRIGFHVRWEVSAVNAWVAAQRAAANREG